MPSFNLAHKTLYPDAATVGIVKDAGDDPDVTHGAIIEATVRFGQQGSGITFHAGPGVGIVTKNGLPIDIGEPAINPVPRNLMREVVSQLCEANAIPPDVEITISVPGGEEIARQTWNPRLGIEGGISILGTTGVVHPFSCSAWIHSIHRGIDVARAQSINHVLGATGSTSETAACSIYDFPEIAMLDMGDFVGALLKYLRKNPISRLTLAGGFAKFTKLSQGALDLHSGRSQVNFEELAILAKSLGISNREAKRIQNANTAMEALEITNKNGVDLPKVIAEKAQLKVIDFLQSAPVEVELMIFSRSGELLARTPRR